MNKTTPRLFIAATRQNDGKTTTSLGLLGALRGRFPRVGFIKPVGQRFVKIESTKIDEDSVLMDTVYGLNCPLADMSPIAVEPDFTRKYLLSANNEVLVDKIRKSFDRVAWEKDFVLCEGTGHAGVGSVFDLSNAQVAKLLNAKVVIVSQGGIGRPIDEVALNQALFDKAGVEIVGVILNKVIPEKMDYIADFARKGFKRRGLELLGVIPHQRVLSSPTMELIRDELDAKVLNDTCNIHNIIDEVVVGAMGVNKAMDHFKPGALIITPGDREDIILGAAATRSKSGDLAGIVLTGGLMPSENVLGIISHLQYPVLLGEADSYQTASKVHDLIIKTRPGDSSKISLIQDLVSRYVSIDKILKAL